MSLDQTKEQYWKQSHCCAFGFTFIWRKERRVVTSFSITTTGKDKQEDNKNLNHHNHDVHFGGFADAEEQEYRQCNNNSHRRQIEYFPCRVKRFVGVIPSHWGVNDPLGSFVAADSFDEVNHVAAPTYGDRGGC